MKKVVYLCVLTIVLSVCLSAFGGCKSEKKATLTVKNVTTYKGYYVEAEPVFSKNPEPITYTTDDAEALTFSGNKITGNAVGTYTVKATTEHLSTTFKVTVKDPGVKEIRNFFLHENSDYLAYLADLMEQISNFSYDEGELALYIGDSFFDTRWFFTDFYQRFEGKNAYSFGISATKAYQWTWYMQKIAYLNPKTLIIHVGTNDIFDWYQAPEVVTDTLENLFNTIHHLLPQTTVYWYTIEQRLNNSNATRNTRAKTVNENVISYAADKPWLTVLNSATATANQDGTPKSELYRDDTHLICPDGYNILTDLLYDAGFEFSVNTKISG